jgi:hypothetical protein
MKDEIHEDIWKVKEGISKEAPGGFLNLASYIKKEAAEIRKTHPFSKGISYPAPSSKIMTCNEEIDY